MNARWRPAVAAAFAVAVALFATARPVPADDLERSYTKAVRAMAHGVGVVRPDGYIFAYDSAQLLRFAAVDGDRSRYVAMRDAIVRRFVVSTGNDHEAYGDVIWRVRDGTPPDASGTTEALALADALLIGAATFDRPDDRVLAHTIAAAYLRHAAVDHGIWFIRNYYNFGTHTYAANSYIIDYLPDVLASAGESDGAQRSLALLDRAMGPAGLFYELIQPEIETAFPGANLAYFSPNALSSIANTCSVALYATRGRPALTKRVLAFGLDRLNAIVRFYNVNSGAASDAQNAGTPAYACLTRLAERLGDTSARAQLEPLLRANAATQLASGNLTPELATAVVFALRGSDK